MPIISVTNQKGGVGKTTLLSSLATILTQQGYKVLSVNLDPQRNLDMVAGKGVAIPLGDRKSPSTLSVLAGELPIQEAIVHTPMGDLVRASSLLSGWQGQKIITEEEYKVLKNNPASLVHHIGERFEQLHKVPDTHVLRNYLWPLKNEYDYIFLDTNPSLMLLTTNALYAADYILIPVFTDDFSKAAVAELWDTIQGINYFEPNRQLKVAGIVVTQSNKNTIIAKSYYNYFQRRATQMNTMLFDTKIRRSVTVSEAMTASQTLVDYAPNSNIAADYRQLAGEFIQRINELEKGRG